MKKNDYNKCLNEMRYEISVSMKKLEDLLDSARIVREELQQDDDISDERLDNACKYLVDIVELCENHEQGLYKAKRKIKVGIC